MPKLFDQILESIPVDHRDAFIRELEDAWGGLWLPFNDPSLTLCSPGFRALQTCWDYVSEADPDGGERWLVLTHKLYGEGLL